MTKFTITLKCENQNSVFTQKKIKEKGKKKENKSAKLGPLVH